MGNSDEAADGRNIPWKLIVAAALVAGLLLLRSYLPLGQWMHQFNTWVADLGPRGMVVFVIVYIVATILFLPASLLTIAAGFLFGLLYGTILVSLGSTIGATSTFLISRYVARDWVARKAAEDQRFEAIDRAVGRQGWKIIGLLRLSPAIPYNLSNYVYGLTSVRLLPYVVASWLGMLPGTVMYVYLGKAGKAGIDAAAGAAERTWYQDAMLGVGLVATVAVTVLITRIARKALASTDLEPEAT